MRRLLVSLVLLLGCVLVCQPAQARWGHWGHWGGHHGCGWGGWGGGWGGYCGYGGYGFGGYGWGGYGCSPYISVGYAGPSYYYPAYNYPLCTIGGCNYGTPVGYYTALPQYYNTNINFAVTALPSVKYPVSAGVNAQALERFLGLAGEVAPAAGPLAERALPRIAARVSSAESRQRAMRHLAEGDALFAKQNFNSALQRYKQAASAAPDVAEAWWRQGHAFVATRNYDLAATAFKRAIALGDDLGRGGFRLDDLYAGHAMAKAGHLESLAELALDKRGEGDAYFLIGLFLHYDGETARAERFFARAAELSGPGSGYLAGFLKSPALVAAKPVIPPPPKPPVIAAAGTSI